MDRAEYLVFVLLGIVIFLVGTLAFYTFYAVNMIVMNILASTS